MARPLKDGLTYFSHDTDMSSDPKVMNLEAEQGIVGYAIYNKLLELIFSSTNGELDFSNKITFKVMAKRFGISQNKFEIILKSCITFKLFDETLYNSKKVLSSNGIKKRFSIVIDERERKRKWKAEHGKLDINDKNSSGDVDGDNSGISDDVDELFRDSRQGSDDESTHRKGKEIESKVNIKESKAYSSITNDGSRQVITLEDLKSSLQNAPNKIGYLGYAFQTLHKSCPKEFCDKAYGRLGKLSKDYNDDYYLILSAIYKTQDGMQLIQGNHLDYIEKYLKNTVNGNGHKESQQQGPFNDEIIRQQQEHIARKMNE